MNVDSVGGLVFPAVRIEAEQLLSPPLYASAIGSVHPEYVSTEAARAAGLAGRLLPPLSFFHTVEESTLLERLGIRYGQTMAVGVEQDFGVLATERDVISGQTVVESAERRTGRDGGCRQVLVLKSEFRLVETDELVSRSRVTFIEVE